VGALVSGTSVVVCVLSVVVTGLPFLVVIQRPPGPARAVTHVPRSPGSANRGGYGQ
jgi:hypothetical protein